MMKTQISFTAIGNKRRSQPQVATIVITLGVTLLCPPGVLRASTVGFQPAGWDQSKAYSAAVKDGVIEAAKDAAAVASVWVASTKNALNEANSLSAAAAASRGLSSGTIAALEAQVVAAEAALDLATAAAGVAGAVAVGAAVGTGIGEIANAGISAVWSLFSSSDAPTPVNAGANPIYAPPSEAQRQQMTSALLASVSSNVSYSDFDAAGRAGMLSRSFIEQGALIAIAELQGAAAARAGHLDQLASAASDLTVALGQYRQTTEQMANLVASTSIQSPFDEIKRSHDNFEALVAIAKAECNGPDCAQISTQLDQAVAALATAEDAAKSITPQSLVGGTNPIFPTLTMDEFKQFLNDTAKSGESALSQDEIALANSILGSSGVSFGSGNTFGSIIAQWDGLGDTNGRETAVFNALGGSMNLSQMLFQSATTLSCGSSASCQGTWLGINPADSYLVTSTIPEPQSLSSVLLGSIVLGGAEILRRRRTASLR